MVRVLGIVFGASFTWTVSLLAQPQITEQPQGRAALAGSRVTLTVQATGATPLRYQWQHNRQDVPGAIGRVLRFTAAPSRAGNYTVVVSDANGQTISSAARIDVAQRPGFVVQPKNTIVGEHKTAVLTTVLNDSGPYRRMIWHNNNPIEGPHEIPPSTGLITDEPTLVMPDCINDVFYNSIYWLAVTNQAAGIISKRIRLTVVGAPRFTGQAKPRDVPPGKTVVFTVRLARDPGPDQPTLQWYKDGRLIPGATTSRLILQNVQPADQGNYYCVAVGIGGTTASWGAQMNVVNSSPPR